MNKSAACPTVLLLTIRRIIYTQRRWLTLTHFMSELNRLTFDGEQLCISIMCLTKTNSKRKLHMHSVMSRLLKAFTVLHSFTFLVLLLWSDYSCLWMHNDTNKRKYVTQSAIYNLIKSILACLFTGWIVETWGLLLIVPNFIESCFGWINLTPDWDNLGFTPQRRLLIYIAEDAQSMTNPTNKTEMKYSYMFHLFHSSKVAWCI